MRVFVSLVLLALSTAPVAAFQNYWVPSASMEPTILVGDHILGWNYSAQDVRRGDIIAFRQGRDIYIKRVVGLPGETIEMKDGVVHIDGEPTPRKLVQMATLPDPFGRERSFAIYRERFPDGRFHLIQEVSGNDVDHDAKPFEVPPGHFFVLGDNRDYSLDSRSQSAVGYVPAEAIRGRIDQVYLSFDNGVHMWEFWRWSGNMRSDRSFTSVYQ